MTRRDAVSGPDVIWAAFAQESGERIWRPSLTARYGMHWLGLLIPVGLMQKAVSAGFLWLGLFWISLWFGAYVVAGSTSLAELTGLPWEWTPKAQSLFWACATILFCF